MSLKMHVLLFFRDTYRCKDRINVRITFQTNFEGGELILTSHRILWGRPGDIPRGNTCLSLSLRYVVFLEEENPGPFSFGRSKKIILHLSEPAVGETPSYTS